MAQSSAAREPTMEEILASIRRIIESNDESAPPRAEQRPQLASIAGIAPLASEAPASLDTATITEARPAAPEKPAAAPPARAISLADVAARLRSRDERPAPAPIVETPPFVANDDRLSAADEELDEEGSDDVAASITGFAPAFEDEGTEEPELTAPELKPAQSDQARDRVVASAEREEQREPVSAARRDTTRGDAARTEASRWNESSASDTEPASSTARAQTGSSSALISTEAGTKVAAAFDDLNSAIAEGRMRSFEELAQELLRPMLSEWLDDNLPTLVERLVREEIERVARGGRR